LRSFDCVSTEHGPSVILITTHVALLVVNDTVVDRIDLRSPFKYQESFTEAGEPVFMVGGWNVMLLSQGDRREFSVFLRKNK